MRDEERGEEREARERGEEHVPEVSHCFLKSIIIFRISANDIVSNSVPAFFAFEEAAAAPFAPSCSFRFARSSSRLRCATSLLMSSVQNNQNVISATNNNRIYEISMKVTPTSTPTPTMASTTNYYNSNNNSFYLNILLICSQGHAVCSSLAHPQAARYLPCFYLILYFIINDISGGEVNAHVSEDNWGVSGIDRE